MSVHHITPSVNDAAKSEKKLAPMTTFTLIAPRYALIGCPSIVGVVVMINLSMLDNIMSDCICKITKNHPLFGI